MHPASPIETPTRAANNVAWWTYIQRQYLTQLDWLLATYFFLVGLGHASELLFFGDMIDAQRAEVIGLANRVVEDGDKALALAQEWAQKLANGPAFAHSMTKQMIESEHTMALAEAIEAEAQAQAICMQHPDFGEAHAAFKEERPPRFVGAKP